jgi:hypothetical protein
MCVYRNISHTTRARAHTHTHTLQTLQAKLRTGGAQERHGRVIYAGKVMAAYARGARARLEYFAAKKQFAAAKEAQDHGVGEWGGGGGGVWDRWPPPLK